MIVEGEFNDGRTSRTFAAYLTAEGDDLVVCDYDDAEVDVAEIDDVVVSSRLGRVPRTFTFPSGSSPPLTSPQACPSVSLTTSSTWSFIS